MAYFRTISLEFLRQGPPHNQLLSPLTQYMGLCGNYNVSPVHVPYEHYDFVQRLKSLRYDYRQHPDHERYYLDFNKTAEEIAEILASLKGFNEEFKIAPQGDVRAIHLDLVLSASELAMLPFELAKVPPDCAGGEGNRLLLQKNVPVCLTRRVRGVSKEYVVWPRKPKILFIIAAPGKLDVPALHHTKALLKAIEPWIPPSDPSISDDREQKTKEILTILPEATVEQIESACSEASYTHVHILAHGIEDTKLPGKPYGLALHDSLDKTKIDVVNGERLAYALRSLRPEIRQDLPVMQFATAPAVVTIAACDSGNVGSVIYNNGASLAHALHRAGIPFVVASQFPLSKRGSIYVAEMLYGRMLWGEDPRIALLRLRSKLHAIFADIHDWASLVTYAALPDDLEVQLEDVRYVQAREALNNALQKVDQILDEMAHVSNHTGQEQGLQGSIDQIKILFRRVDEAAERMPTTKAYETEGIGLLASTAKRKAEACWYAFLRTHKNAQQNDFFMQCLGNLQQSLEYYKKAYSESMRESMTVIRGRRSLHWVMGQYMLVRAVLGEAFLRDHWGAAMVSAQVDLEEAQGMGTVWPHGTLAELYLILLAYKPEHLPIAPEEIHKYIVEHIEALVLLAGPDSFPVYSTRRQFNRYIQWWGDEQFVSRLEKEGRVRERSWTEPGGLVELAQQAVNMLTR